MIARQIFPRSLRPRCGPSRRIPRVLRLRPRAEASPVSPGTSVQAALLRNQWDRAAESPQTFPMAPSLFAEAEAEVGTALPEPAARAVPPGQERDSGPPPCLPLRAADRSSPSLRNPFLSDDAACSGEAWLKGV